MDDILPEDVEMVAQGIRRAAALYPDTAAIRALQVAAMKAAKDFSWVKATRQYVDHFVVRRRRAPRRARARRSLLRPGEGRPGSLRNLCRNLPPPPALALRTRRADPPSTALREALHTHPAPQRRA